MKKRGFVSMSNKEQIKIPFGNYEIFRKLATGGMAELYLAKQRGLGNFQRTVVLKCILPQFAEDPEFVTMFFDEAKIASFLNHPNIVQIYELGNVEDIHYISMEYIRGPNFKKLRKILVENYSKPPFELIAGLIAQSAEGLHYAHTAIDEEGNSLAIVHRDVSPTNILLNRNGIVKIVDFGVAKATVKEHKTRAGMVKGKYRYMSPEQILGKEIDHRSDIFALGIVLYELSTGVILFKRPTEAETIKAVYQDPIAPPSRIIPDYPPELEAIVMKALERDVQKRYQSCSEMKQDLLTFMRERGKNYTPEKIREELVELFADLSSPKTLSNVGFGLSKSDFIRFGIAPSPELRSYHTSSALSTVEEPEQTPSLPPKAELYRHYIPENTPPEGALKGKASSSPSNLHPRPFSDDVKAIKELTDSIESEKIEYSGKSSGEIDHLKKITGQSRVGQNDFSIEEPADEHNDIHVKGKKNKLFPLLLVLALLGGVAAGGFFFLSSKEEKVALSTKNKLNTDGKYSKAFVQADTSKAKVTKSKAGEKEKSPENISDISSKNIESSSDKAESTAEKEEGEDSQKIEKKRGRKRRAVAKRKRYLRRRNRKRKSNRKRIVKQTKSAPSDEQKKIENTDSSEKDDNRALAVKPIVKPADKLPKKELPPPKNDEERTERAKGTLFIFGSPTNSKIEIIGNGKKFFSLLPLNGKALPPGEYIVKVSHPGYSPFRKAIHLKEGGVKELTIKLNPVNTKPKPIKPFSAFPIKTKRVSLRIFIADPRGISGNIYTNKFKSLCKKIERGLKEIMGAKFDIDGVTIPLQYYVKKYAVKSGKSRLTFYPRAIAYVIYKNLSRGRSKFRVSQLLLLYFKKKRFKKYANY